ncbi:MAG: hypothetical protein PHQ54_01225 [Candidatus Omnitrophica bacterium]|nr:hypothetical protein [Candidatus Omnitrophota bacterium]
MNIFKKILLVLVCAGICFQYFSIENCCCRRVQLLDARITPPPGVNSESLFKNIWAILESSNLNPNGLAQAYPEVSYICSQGLGAQKLTEEEYDRIIADISRATGIDQGNISRYRSYFFNYDRSDLTNVFNYFGQEFTRILGTGNTKDVFNFMRCLGFVRYLAIEIGHNMLKEKNVGSRQSSLELATWVLLGGQSKRADGAFLQGSKDYIVENGEDILACVLVYVFNEIEEAIAQDRARLERLEEESTGSKHDLGYIEIVSKELRDKEIYYKELFSWFIGNLYGNSYLKNKVDALGRRIADMSIDSKIKESILMFFPQVP